MCDTPDITVYYDGKCPFCKWEVGLYSRMDKAGHIAWQAIETLAEKDLPTEKSHADLLGKFHVRDMKMQKADWHIGIDAFARIWQVLPGLRHLAFLFRVPVMRQLTMLAYRFFLKWQSYHRKHRRMR